MGHFCGSSENVSILAFSDDPQGSPEKDYEGNIFVVPLRMTAYCHFQRACEDVSIWTNQKARKSDRKYMQTNKQTHTNNKIKIGF